MHPTPGATEAPTSQGLTLAEHQAIRAIGLQPTPGPWQRIEWTRHAATTLVVADTSAATGLRVVAEFESEADAAIGEACPDMLAALQAMLEHFHTIELSGGHAAVQLGRAAVAKALGGAARGLAPEVNASALAERGFDLAQDGGEVIHGKAHVGAVHPAQVRRVADVDGSSGAIEGAPVDRKPQPIGPLCNLGFESLDGGDTGLRHSLLRLLNLTAQRTAEAALQIRTAPSLNGDEGLGARLAMGDLANVVREAVESFGNPATTLPPEFESEPDAAIGEVGPDMLAALQAMLEHFHTIELSGGHAAVQLARAAVSKALRQPVQPAFELLSGPLPINLESLAKQRPRRYDVYVLHPSFAEDGSHAPAPVAESSAPRGSSECFMGPTSSIGGADIFSQCGPTTPVSRWLARHPRAGLPLLLLALLALWGLAGGAAPPLELLP